MPILIRSLCDWAWLRVELAAIRLVVLALAAMLAAQVMFSLPLVAHEGHDHDGPPPLNLPVASRVVAVTPELELVGVISGENRLTIFLHRFESNEPVKGAKMTVSAGDDGVAAIPKGDGVFELQAPWVKSGQQLDLIFALELPQGEDLLTGQLKSVEALGGPRQAISVGGEPAIWQRYETIVTAAGAFFLGLLLALFIRSRSRPLTEAAEDLSNKSAMHPSATLRKASAIVVGTLILLLDPLATPPASAEAAKPPAERLPSMATDTPQRMPDGTLFVPKATQHLLSVRTMLTASSHAPRSFEIVGTVIADPSGFGRVQPARPGRIEAPSSGLAYLGKRVEKGALLAYLVPYIEAADKATIQSQIAETEGRIKKLQTILSRYDERPGAVPQVRVDEVRGELDALRKRRAELEPSLVQREEIRSPVSGIVSASNVVTGQIVDAKEILFEIINPERFWIEAIAYDPTVTENLAKAIGVTNAGKELPLEFAGQGLSLKQQAVPVSFRITQSSPPVSIGTPVRVILQARQDISGIVVPAASVVTAPSGLSIVWIKKDAERFEPQPVLYHQIDSKRVVISSGLEADVRIVTEGATILNQIR